MDEFVALTAVYGLKPRGKSAPMAALKRSAFDRNSVKTSPFDSGDDDANAELTLKDSKFDSLNPGGFDDFSVFDELIKLSSTNDSGDNDLMGGLTGLSPNEDGFDELIPGFGGSGQPSNNEFQETEAVQVNKQQFGLDDDLEALFISPVASAQFLDDLSPLFGGKSDKRRLARWEREQIIKDRMEKAIADMNNRDHQIQIEQEERSRISETLDAEIKLWATGKEGNLRALISSLHLVLWPGCGWEAVSLTDLITSAAVKKVYKKANLYVHPDKVHQKGTQQKYIAEKVFNILQEAWNKFNKEELS
ncbi:auxilin-related protein 2 [Brassica rapa]|uniref:J domain-containing protein n=1 Tax=Brassica campestris TaxID=3711 RepID=M4DGP9_BRACM|nr:auxilin-related protein 2 [Brassica rapa]